MRDQILRAEKIQDRKNADLENAEPEMRGDARDQSLREFC